MNRLDRGREVVGRSSPNRFLDYLLEENGVLLRVFNVWPVGANGFVVALVRQIRSLERTKQWLLLLWSVFLKILSLYLLTSGNSLSRPNVSLAE